MDKHIVTPNGNYDKIICANEHDTPKNAKKYCTKCQKFLCSDCLVDFDVNHLKENFIISIDDYFNKFKDTISNMSKSIQSSKQVIIPFQKTIKAMIDSKADNIINHVDNFTNTLIKELENFNNSVKTQMSKFKEQFMNEMRENSMLFKYLDSDFDVMLNELEKYFKNWDVSLKSDKNKIINEVISLYSQPEREIKQTVENFESLREGLTSIAVRRQSELDKVYADLNFEEKLKKICNIIHRHPINPPIIPNPVNDRKEIKLLEIGIVRDLNNTIKDFSDNTNSIDSGIDHTFIMGLRNNSNNVYVYWNKKIHEISIGPKNLENLKSRINKACPFTLKNSRIANIGNYAILTGGSNEAQLEIRECFQIQPIIDKNNLKLVVSDFPPMNNARERHNMIYLPNFNCIVVCSSFQKSISTEICYLNDKKWTNLRDMNSRRANSTLTFVNERWLFCISGYIVDLEQSNGVYSNNYEVLDMRDVNSGWRQYNFTNEFDVLKMSAMGCINLNNSDFILLGGFNGQKYVDCSFHVTTENGKLATIKRLDNTLDSGVIFQNASFLRSGKSYINFDYNKICELSLLK
jgi:hypothetical protein